MNWKDVIDWVFKNPEKVIIIGLGITATGVLIYTFYNKT